MLPGGTAAEDTNQGIIILGRNGVVLMIVTLRAANSQPQKHLGSHIDLIVTLFA